VTRKKCTGFFNGIDSNILSGQLDISFSEYFTIASDALDSLYLQSFSMIAGTTEFYRAYGLIWKTCFTSFCAISGLTVDTLLHVVNTELDFWGSVKAAVDSRSLLIALDLVSLSLH
jgi:hypothetical protein